MLHTLQPAVAVPHHGEQQVEKSDSPLIRQVHAQTLIWIHHHTK